MRSRSSSENEEGQELGMGLACVGFHSGSRSRAGHAGRRGKGMGVRLSGYRFAELEDLLEGRGAFHLPATQAGDWLLEMRGCLMLSFSEVARSRPALG